VGAVPDRSSATGVTALFAEFQLIAGDTWLPYVPNAADVRLVDLRTTRLPLWHQALEAIAMRPWLGWGPGGYVEAQRAMHPEDGRYSTTMAHAHNLLLDTWAERGIVGLTGLLVLAGLLALRVLQQRDRAMAVVLAATALLNLFDTTLLNGALIYPLAAVLGWRAVGRRTTALAETGTGSAAAVRVALAAADVGVALASIALGQVVASGGWGDTIVSSWTPGLTYAAFLWPAFAWANGLYPGYGRSFHHELARTIRAAMAATVSLGFVALAFPASGIAVSPVGILATLISSIALAPVARLGVKGLLAAARLWGRPVAIVGTGPIGERIARYLVEHRGVGLTPVAAFGDSAWGLRELPVTGSTDRAWGGLIALNVRHVIVTPEVSGTLGYDEILRHTRRTLPIVHFVPDLHGIPSTSVSVAPLGTSFGLEMRNHLASGSNRALKRAFDIAAVTVGGLLISPALAAIALAIRMDSPGPILYRQTRLGRDGRSFRVWKFRSMVLDAEARLAELLASDDRARAEWEATQKLVNDPRITRIGRILRKTSLDELPQLWNVLMGEMSLVGPRPIVEAEIEKYADAFELYTQVRPGITGFWQVSGRSDTSYEYRVELDAYYVRNWSLWLDIEILLRTVRVVLGREGAY
jgi:Undecaprenyl-phosphate galactose phosphotransferase WbaP